MAEPITSADWSTPARPSPLADLQAIGAAFRELGEPLDLFPPPRGEDFSAINALLREIIDQTRKPLSADLTADPLACAILRQWARQPWQEAHRAALVDRMLLSGHEEWETAWARRADWQWFEAMRDECRSRPRRTVRRLLLGWRSDLIRQFGDFESNTLP